MRRRDPASPAQRRIWSLQYAPGAIETDSVLRIGGHFTALLESAAADPGARLSELRC